MRRAECVGKDPWTMSDLDRRIAWMLGKGRGTRALPIGRMTAHALDRNLRMGRAPVAHLPHQLRHAFATSWLAEVRNENELMLVAGWTTAPGR